MRRTRIISTAICLGIIGAILPLVSTLFLAWAFAFQEESKTLYEYATRMLKRAKYTLNETRKTLSLLERDKNNSSICSLKHIKKMNEASTLITEAKMISYFEQGIEYCTSCGASDTKKPRSKTYFTLPDGLEIGEVTQLESTYNIQAPLIPVRKSSNYDVLINSNRLSDIIIPNEVWLGIIYNGKIISEQNKIPPSLLAIITDKVKKDNLSQYYQKLDGKDRLKPADALKKNQIFILDNSMILISQYGPFYFIVSQPKSVVEQRYKKIRAIFLPFGLMTTFFIIGLVIVYSRRRLSFKVDLEIALTKNEFFVCYQPIIDTRSGKCTGAEALSRWQRPNGQVISPDFFIPFAEETGIISSITKKVIDLVFKEMEPLLVQNKDLHISINASDKDIHNDYIINLLEDKILKSKIKRDQIWIELTERIYLTMDEVKKFIIQARTLGYIIAIDDFGTGFSNLSYLQNFPLDIIKIDKSFIDSLGTHSATSNVADHIIKMAKNVNLKLIAEGVEKNVQYDYLKAKEVDYIQGYLFSKPLSADNFIQFFNKNLIKN